jgi:hypothetical protein
VRRQGAVARIAIALALAVMGLGAGASAAGARVHQTRPHPTPAPQMRAHHTRPRHPVSRVPPGFVGVDIDGPIIDPPLGFDVAQQFSAMVASGVENVRVAFNWALAQPYPTAADVPADQQSQFTDIGGVPTDFGPTDQIVTLAAQHGISVLPTVLYAPAWDAAQNGSGIAFPARPGPYANYLTALIQRYGPHGSFWRSYPKIPRMPIRMWQIWNEEQLGYYWHQPFVTSYVALLRASHRAIKRADPGARVVLGSVTNTAWRILGQIYRKGARKLFDVVSVNAFTKTPANVLLYLHLTRRAMDRFKDSKKPLIASELSWPSARGQTTSHFDWDTTRAGQARNIARLLPRGGAAPGQRGVLGFDYYTWIGLEEPQGSDFSFAGLEGMSPSGAVFTKPALGAFRRGALGLERCKVKSSSARRCAKRVR